MSALYFAHYSPHRHPHCRKMTNTTSWYKQMLYSMVVVVAFPQEENNAEGIKNAACHDEPNDRHGRTGKKGFAKAFQLLETVIITR